MRLLPDSLRLAVGTLTILPVKPPVRVDRKVAGWAMTFAPLVGLVLAAIVGVPLWLLADAGAGSPFLLASLSIGALAWLTRAMHLDGLADVADGLGSGRRGEDALAIMKKSDIGPFGVATLLLVLLIQVAALAHLLGQSATLGTGAVVAALLWSRLTITSLSRRFQPARSDGLGAVVARTVSLLQECSALVLCAAFTGALVAFSPGSMSDWGLTHSGIWVLTALAVAMTTGTTTAERCARRFAGVTGDVYGAAVETTFTAILVALALVA